MLFALTQPVPTNVLWKFDGNNWTWVSGSRVSQTPTYGAKGVPASTNIPGARAEHVTWVDMNENVWIFGGQGYSSTGRKHIHNYNFVKLIN